MKKLAAAAGLGALGLLLAPATARACGGPGFGYLHRALPSRIPADAIVAEIELELNDKVDLRPTSSESVRGRVRRVIQGYYSGATLIVRSPLMCGVSPFGNGQSGFLIGTPDGMENGELVVDPTLAPRSSTPGTLDALRLSGRQGAGVRPNP